LPRSQLYIALAEVPVLVLVNETATGLQPPDLSAVKLAVNCALIVDINKPVHASKQISLP